MAAAAERVAVKAAAVVAAAMQVVVVRKNADCWKRCSSSSLEWSNSSRESRMHSTSTCHSHPQSLHHRGG